MKARLDALLEARFAGVRSVMFNGRRVEYQTDAELARAVADLERRIAQAERRRSRAIKAFAVKDL